MKIMQMIEICTMTQIYGKDPVSGLIEKMVKNGMLSDDMYVTTT